MEPSVTTPALKSALSATTETLLSIGALSLIYDLGLRRELHTELLKLVGIQRSISSNHVSGASRNADAPWPDLLTRKADYRCILVDPLLWTETNWQLIADSARQRKVHVSLVVPDPTAPYLNRFADFLGVSEQQASSSIQQAIELVESRWKDLSEQKRIITGSTIEVRHAVEMPSYSIVIADQSAIMSHFSVAGKRGSDLGFSVIFDGPLDSFPMNWLARQVETNSGAIAYSNEVT